MEQPLTASDQKVLEEILGCQGTCCNEIVVDNNMAPDRHIETSIVQNLVKQEKQAISDFEAGDHAAALLTLNNIIAVYPEYASVYVNRAQVVRVVGGPHDPEADLHKAISLADPYPSKFVSRMQVNVLRNSHYQLSAIYKERSLLPEYDQDSWTLQQRASDMMLKAGVYGDKLASSVAVGMNPYAKLCGNIMLHSLSSECTS